MVHRRQLLAMLAGTLALPTAARAQTPALSRATAYAFTFNLLEGGTLRLADHAGRPILIVNVASFCGYTPQYAGLEELWQRFRDRGLLLVGVPSNDFNQEPGGPEQIAATAHEYRVSFPIAEKAALRGPGAHPFYRWAAVERPLDVPRWNFHKYLIGRDGRIAAAFPTRVEPMDAQVIAAIAKELAS